MCDFTQSGKSLIKIMNSSGPRTLPCNIPLVTVAQSNWHWATKTFCLLSVKNAFTHDNTLLFTPYPYNLIKSLSCATVRAHGITSNWRQIRDIKLISIIRHQINVKVFTMYIFYRHIYTRFYWLFTCQLWHISFFFLYIWFLMRRKSLSGWIQICQVTYRTWTRTVSLIVFRISSLAI